ncbi:DUF4382 domain-containing protein [Thalassotalea atypica]|uniref:DUF4382 domain-containing protein n=1 Tax=Thalassotalea atypica TaxID=2054316 RepID=UPI0025727DD0|nr:DUF4382 domain-containing protein [Thalassotalea atypica]
MRTFQICFLSGLLISCGGGSSSSEDNSPPVVDPQPTPLVSFSVSDAPVDAVTSVNVTFSSITLKSVNDDDEDDESGLNIPILDDNGNPTTMTINLMDYQDGEQKLIIDKAEVNAGKYTNLILNTSGCPQNQNGSTEFCWVVDNDGIKTLKTPSNKLKLGAVSVSTASEQAFTIEFNLRSSMTVTAGGASYNLKPHGVRIVDGTTVGSLSGTVDVNLLTAGEGCDTVYEEGVDHGKIIYLYEGEVTSEAVMGDEYDLDIAQNEIPENVIQPYTSDSVSLDIDSGTYNYHLSQLPAGDYTVAFSCGAVGDDPEEYDSIAIANPSNQLHNVTIEANIGSVINFTEE